MICKYAEQGAQTRCLLVDEVIDNEGPTAQACPTFEDDPELT